ncbi:MAG: arginase family protein, partial [Planctomycetes bacterium]|nr:arginase family protein [Planctomycetota bacterium]
ATGLGDPDLTRLLAIGGDHSIALANLRVAWQRAGRPSSGLPLIHIDAHLDTVDVVWGERYGHGSFLIRAIEEGVVDPKRTLSLGVRGPLNTLKDLDFGRESGITVVGMSRWVEDRASVAAIISEFRARLGDDECYLTLDIDACDPSCAPGTGTPVSGGFSAAELFLALRWLAGIRLAGADVVEVCPARDHQGITALLAAQAAFQILCIDAAAHAE